MERTRQRVDAGEPRNTYCSSIRGYQITPTASPYSTSATGNIPCDEWASMKEDQCDCNQIRKNEELIKGVKRPSSRQSQTSDAEILKKKIRSNGQIEVNQGDETEKKTASPSSCTGAVSGNECNSANRSKRKLYQPNHLDMKITNNAMICDGEEEDDESDRSLSMTKSSMLKSVASTPMQQRIGEIEKSANDVDSLGFEPLANLDTLPEEKSAPIAEEIKTISVAVKSHLYSSVCRIVDEWMEKMHNFIRSETAQSTDRSSQHQPGPYVAVDLEPNRAGVPAPPFSTTSVTGSTAGGQPQPVANQTPDSNPASANAVSGPRPPLFFNPFYYNSFPYAPAGLNFAAGQTNSVGVPPSSIFQPFPLGGVVPSTLASGSSHAPSPYVKWKLREKLQSVAMANCVPHGASSDSSPVARKKYIDVTDTRAMTLNLRNDDLGQLHAAAADGDHQLQESPAANATSFFASSGGSEIMSYDPSMPQSVILTSVHLRKAKLMFFYTRYPTSELLEACFPDIHFDKQNTAQVIKWFSNSGNFTIYKSKSSPG